MIYVVDVKFQGSIEDLSKEIKKDLKEDLNQAVKTLGAGALKNAQDLADKHLPKKLAGMYKDALKIEEIADNIVVIELNENARWIEEGRKSGFMEELLKGSGVKKGKDGSKYRVIPLEGKENIPQQSSAQGQNLVNELTSFLKTKNIRAGKNEGLALDNQGSPRIGRIHSFDIKDIRDKKAFSDNIQRVSVFQNKNPQTGKTEKSITAFRVISEKHKGTGKWNHPGTSPARILEQTFKWVEQTLQTQIFPAIKSKYNLK